MKILTLAMTYRFVVESQASIIMEVTNKTRGVVEIEGLVRNLPAAPNNLIPQSLIQSVHLFTILSLSPMSSITFILPVIMMLVAQ